MLLQALFLLAAGSLESTVPYGGCMHTGIVHVHVDYSSLVVVYLHVQFVGLCWCLDVINTNK